jgi:hypothetical protein
MDSLPRPLCTGELTSPHWFGACPGPPWSWRWRPAARWSCAGSLPSDPTGRLRSSIRAAAGPGSLTAAAADGRSPAVVAEAVAAGATAPQRRSPSTRSLTAESKRRLENAFGGPWDGDSGGGTRDRSGGIEETHRFAPPILRVTHSGAKELRSRIHYSNIFPRRRSTLGPGQSDEGFRPCVMVGFSPATLDHFLPDRAGRRA